MRDKRAGIVLAWVLVSFVGAGSVLADGIDLAAPKLYPALPLDMLSAPRQAVTTGGVECVPGKEVCISPLIGFNHQKRESIDSVRSLTHHDFTIRAGWRLSLFDSLELSTSAKLPLVSAEQNQGVMAGDYRSGATTRIRASEQPLLVRNSMNWGSDVLLKLNNRFNLNLFYDINKSPAGMQGMPASDERFGTRLEYKFK